MTDRVSPRRDLVPDAMDQNAWALVVEAIEAGDDRLAMRRMQHYIDLTFLRWDHKRGERD